MFSIKIIWFKNNLFKYLNVFYFRKRLFERQKLVRKCLWKTQLSSPFCKIWSWILQNEGEIRTCYFLLCNLLQVWPSKEIQIHVTLRIWRSWNIMITRKYILRVCNRISGLTVTIIKVNRCSCKYCHNQHCNFTKD